MGRGDTLNFALAHSASTMSRVVSKFRFLYILADAGPDTFSIQSTHSILAAQQLMILLMIHIPLQVDL